jgi:H+/Cl- antiporter ClcA
VTPPSFHQGSLNVLAWVISVAGVISFIAASVGLALVIKALLHDAAVDTTEELRGSYYVLRYSRQAVWPFVAVIALSVIITFAGLSRTDCFLNYMARHH